VIANHGDAPSGPFRIGTYSTDSSVDLGGTDVPLLAAGATTDLSWRITLPGDLPPGNYSFRAKIDSLDMIQESDEKNNTVDIPGTLTVVAP
jgi:subtilase family serine protease